MEKVAYKIVFPGPPIPLARPRLSKWGIYDPQTSLKKKTIACLLQQKATWQKISGAVGIYFEFHMPLPKCSKKQQERLMKAHHVKRPDLSNMIKYYEDCLQPEVFDDDSQIVEITARKINALVSETIVYVWRIDDDLQNI